MKKILSVICLLSTASLGAWNTPVAVSPTTGSNQYCGVTFDWNAVASSVAYQIEIDTVAAFNSPVRQRITKTYINSSSGNSDTQHNFTNLYFGKTYYWHLRAYIANDTSAWSTSWNVLIRDYVTMNSPTTGSSQWSGLTLDWLTHTGVSFYDMQCDTTPLFNSGALRSSTDAYINSSSSNTDTDEYLNNLFFGKTYYWRVRARNSVDTTSWSTPWTFTTRDYVTMSLPATGSSQWSGLTLDWLAHTGVSYYDMQCDTTPLFNSGALRSSTDAYINSNSGNTDTEEYLSDLYFGKTYYWRVRARNTVDTTAWSSPWTFITRDYVTMSLPATGSSQWTGLTLDWLAHTGVDYYDMQCDTTPLFNSSALRTSTDAYINSVSSNTDTEEYLSDLYFGKTYYWRVRVRNAVDTTAWSSPWTFITRDYVTMSSPATGSNQWSGLTLDWLAHPGVDYYDMQCDTTPFFNSGALRTSTDAYINSVSSNTDTEEYLSDLYFGRTYYWRVRARNGVDTTAWSSPWTFNTANYVTLNSPASASTQWAGLTLDWLAHPGVDFYDMQADTSANFNSPALVQSSDPYINSVSSNSDTDQWIEDLFFGKRYYWRVRARNAVDTTAWSAVWYFNTADYVTQVSPANSQLNVSTAGVTLDWNAHAGVNFYQVQFDTINQYNSPAMVMATKTYVNTSNGNTDTQHGTGAMFSNRVYFWRVRAINAVDTTAWTERWYSTGTTIPVIPAVPVLVSPANNATAQAVSLSLTWNTAANATAYQYEYATNSNFSGSVSGQVTGTSVAVSLNPSTIYWWRVRAVNVNNVSAWSTVWSFSTTGPMNTPVHISPANLSTSISVNGTTLSWNSVANANQYQYEFSADPTFTTGVTGGSTASTSVSTGALNVLTTYYWHIRATDGNTWSSWSNAWSFTTENVLTAPSLVSPAHLSTGISVSGVTLDWNNVANATSYEYEYSMDQTFSSGVNSGTVTASTASTAALSSGSTYYWRVRATDGNIYSPWSVTWSFSTQNVLSAPTLVSPADLSSSQAVAGVTLTWSVVANANSYEYQYSTDQTFSSGVSMGSTGLNYTTTMALNPLTTYYWRIRATDGNVYSGWSVTWSFTTENILAVPVHISPADLSTGIVNISVTLSWNPVATATLYEYEYSTDQTFSSGVVSGTTASSSYATGFLSPLTTYYWHIRATDGNTWSAWSLPWSFTTDNSTGLAETVLPHALLAYPNPAAESVSLSWEGEYSALEIYDASGQIVFRMNTEGLHNTRIDMNSFSEGIYLVRLTGTESAEVRILKTANTR